MKNSMMKQLLVAALVVAPSLRAEEAKPAEVSRLAQARSAVVSFVGTKAGALTSWSKSRPYVTALGVVGVATVAAAAAYQKYFAEDSAN